MRPDLLALAAELSQRGEGFVMATVVRREAPSSAQVGDRAIITADGGFHGWLGGSCTQPSVVREARRALDDGRPRLIALSPEPDRHPRPGVISLPMTCHSGGRVDIYLETVRPAPRLLVYGVSLAARAAARIGGVLGYAVEAIDPEADAASFPDAQFVNTDPTAPELAHRAGADPARLVAIVATLGVWDEDALEHAIGLSPSYLGLVASRKRFAEVGSVLRHRGVSDETIAAIHAPAGLDIGAVTPEEIALSILTEVVQIRAPSAPPSPPGDEVPVEETAIDPVCGMTVTVATSRHRADHGGRVFHFCCAGCRDRFLQAPESFLEGSAAEEVSRS